MGVSTTELSNAVLEKTRAGKLQWRRAWFNSLGGYKAKVGEFKFHIWKGYRGGFRLSITQSHNRATNYLNSEVAELIWEYLRGWDPNRPINFEDVLAAVNKL